MKKFINFLLKFSQFLQYIAFTLQDYKEALPEYYVYIPSRGKPYYKHSTFKSAKTEAERLAKKCTDFEEIEVLKIEQRIWGNIPDVPF